MGYENVMCQGCEAILVNMHKIRRYSISAQCIIVVDVAVDAVAVTAPVVVAVALLSFVFRV